MNPSETTSMTIGQLQLKRVAKIATDISQQWMTQRYKDLSSIVAGYDTKQRQRRSSLQGGAAAQQQYRRRSVSPVSTVNATTPSGTGSRCSSPSTTATNNTATTANNKGGSSEGASGNNGRSTAGNPYGFDPARLRTTAFIGGGSVVGSEKGRELNSIQQQQSRLKELTTMCGANKNDYIVGASELNAIREAIEQTLSRHLVVLMEVDEVLKEREEEDGGNGHKHGSDDACSTANGGGTETDIDIMSQSATSGPLAPRPPSSVASGATARALAAQQASASIQATSMSMQSVADGGASRQTDLFLGSPTTPAGAGVEEVIMHPVGRRLRYSGGHQQQQRGSPVYSATSGADPEGGASATMTPPSYSPMTTRRVSMALSNTSGKDLDGSMTIPTPAGAMKASASSRQRRLSDRAMRELMLEEFEGLFDHDEERSIYLDMTPQQRAVVLEQTIRLADALAMQLTYFETNERIPDVFINLMAVDEDNEGRHQGSGALEGARMISEAASRKLRDQALAELQPVRVFNISEWLMCLDPRQHETDTCQRIVRNRLAHRFSKARLERSAQCLQEIAFDNTTTITWAPLMKAQCREEGVADIITDEIVFFYTIALGRRVFKTECFLPLVNLSKINGLRLNDSVVVDVSRLLKLLSAQQCSILHSFIQALLPIVRQSEEEEERRELAMRQNPFGIKNRGNQESTSPPSSFTSPSRRANSPTTNNDEKVMAELELVSKSFGLYSNDVTRVVKFIECIFPDMRRPHQQEVSSIIYHSFLVAPVQAQRIKASQVKFSSRLSLLSTQLAIQGEDSSSNPSPIADPTRILNATQTLANMHQQLQQQTEQTSSRRANQQGVSLSGTGSSVNTTTPLNNPAAAASRKDSIRSLNESGVVVSGTFSSSVESASQHQHHQEGTTASAEATVKSLNPKDILGTSTTTQHQAGQSKLFIPTQRKEPFPSRRTLIHRSAHALSTFLHPSMMKRLIVEIERYLQTQRDIAEGLAGKLPPREENPGVNVSLRRQQQAMSLGIVTSSSIVHEIVREAFPDAFFQFVRTVRYFLLMGATPSATSAASVEEDSSKTSSSPNSSSSSLSSIKETVVELDLNELLDALRRQEPCNVEASRAVLVQLWHDAIPTREHHAIIKGLEALDSTLVPEKNTLNDGFPLQSLTSITSDQLIARIMLIPTFSVGGGSDVADGNQQLQLRVKKEAAREIAWLLTICAPTRTKAGTPVPRYDATVTMQLLVAEHKQRIEARKAVQQAIKARGMATNSSTIEATSSEKNNSTTEAVTSSIAPTPPRKPQTSSSLSPASPPPPTSNTAAIRQRQNLWMLEVVSPTSCVSSTMKKKQQDSNKPVNSTTEVSATFVDNDDVVALQEQERLRLQQSKIVKTRAQLRAEAEDRLMKEHAIFESEVRLQAARGANLVGFGDVSHAAYTGALLQWEFDSHPRDAKSLISTTIVRRLIASNAACDADPNLRASLEDFIVSKQKPLTVELEARQHGDGNRGRNNKAQSRQMRGGGGEHDEDDDAEGHSNRSPAKRVVGLSAAGYGVPFSVFADLLLRLAST